MAKWKGVSVTSFSLVRGWLQSLFGLFIAFMFYWIFNSPFLAVLAAAFFFFIPFYTGGRVANGLIFVVLMVLVLYMAFNYPGTSGLGLDLGGSLWDPTSWNVSSLVFIGMWLIGLLGGISSVQSKQAIGVLVILVMFFIFTTGVGTQEVGTAFFGQWWPTVHSFGSQIFGPLGDIFGQLQATFGMGLQLLTNPVGYAQQIMSGTYTRDADTGLSGAFGVEIESFTVTPVYPFQPFNVMMNIKNKGANEAENINVMIRFGEKAPAAEPASKEKVREFIDKTKTKVLEEVDNYKEEAIKKIDEFKEYALEKTDSVIEKINTYMKETTVEEVVVGNLNTLKSKLTDFNEKVLSNADALEEAVGSVIKNAKDKVTEKLSGWGTKIESELSALGQMIPVRIIGIVWDLLKLEVKHVWKIIWIDYELKDTISVIKEKITTSIGRTSNNVDTMRTATGDALQSAYEEAKKEIEELEKSIDDKLTELKTEIEERGIDDITLAEVVEPLGRIRDSILAVWEIFIEPGGAILMEDIGMATQTEKEPKTICTDYVCSQSIENLTKMDIRQLFFESNGITCENVVKYDLLKKFIPLEGVVSYDYKMDSSFSIEVMSKNEWGRLVSEGKFITQTKKASQLTNSPARLNIDSLEQPIREGTPFHIALSLVSAQGKDTEIERADIMLAYPKEFKLRGKCSPAGIEIEDESKPDMKELRWNNLQSPFLVFCYFDPISNLSVPTKTFIITANTTYRFKKWESRDIQFQFGGIACCKEDGDCPGGQKCDKVTNICGYSVVGVKAKVCCFPNEPESFCVAGYRNFLDNDITGAAGDSDYCARKINGDFRDDFGINPEPCEHYEGQCSGNEECDQDERPSNPEWGDNLTCREITV